MKTIMKKQSIVYVFLAGVLLLQGTSVAFAQYYDNYDTVTTYPTYDTVTTYPSYDTVSTYPTYDTGTSYSTYDTVTTYPTYDTVTTYPTYDTVTTYPTYDTVTTYPTYDTSVAYPTYDTVTTYPTYDTGVSYPAYTTAGVTTPSYGISGYSSPSVQIGIGYGSTGYSYGGYNTPTVGSYGYTYNQGGYTNNNTVNNTVSCPSGSTLVNGTCRINTASCPSGSTLVNGTCQINSASCPSGSTLVNGVCTITTVNTNYTCWNGTIVAYASLCPVNYPTVNYTPPTVYQPPVVRYPTITPVPTVKFNNVVTSVVTQITNTSGRCNGIGLIANNAPSTGWFEYGETASLGRSTASAHIGNSSSAPFSNVLTNLKSSTRYYCRAVMQNEYGIVKGEIVSFVTKSKSVSYVKPVVAKKTTTKVTKKVTAPVKKVEVTCTDGTTVWVKNESQASILSQGEKLVTLRVEKSEGKLSANSPVSYRITYKNATDSRLTGVVVKVLIPAEVKFSLASSGVYDEATHILTINQDTLDAHAEGVVAISGKIAQDATIGKSIVTTAYVIYTVPNTSVQDEVTAYVVGSITPNDSVSNKDTGAKKVIGSGSGSERGFMPNNLVEWLALIAIIFIIIILVRSVYVSYQEDRENGR